MKNPVASLGISGFGKNAVMLQIYKTFTAGAGTGNAGSPNKLKKIFRG